MQRQSENALSREPETQSPESAAPSKEEKYKEFCKTLAPYTSKTVFNYYWRKEIEMKTFTPSESNPYKSAYTEKYERFYDSFSASPKPSPLHEFQDCLSQSFIVGETHSDVSPKRFLCENMSHLKEQGYEALFMEHLYYDAQADLDEYFKTGEMPDRLKKQLEELDEGHGWLHRGEKKKSWGQNNFTAIVTEARKAGIRIIAIDISYIYGLQGRRERKERVPEMNYGAYEIMRHEIEENHYTKWIALMGNSHAIRCEGEPTPGMNEMMGVRSVLFFDEETAHLDIRLDSSCTKHSPGGQGTPSRDITFHADALVFANHTTSFKEIFPAKEMKSDEAPNSMPKVEQPVAMTDSMSTLEPELLPKVMGEGGLPSSTVEEKNVVQAPVPEPRSLETVVLTSEAPFVPEPGAASSGVDHTTRVESRSFATTAVLTTKTPDTSSSENTNNNPTLDEKNESESMVLDPVISFKDYIQKNVINELIREAIRLVIIYDTGASGDVYRQKLEDQKLPRNGRLPLSFELPSSLPSEAELKISNENARNRLTAIRNTLTDLHGVLGKIGIEYTMNDRDSQIKLKGALEGAIKNHLPQYDHKYSTPSKSGRIILNIATAFTLFAPLIKKYFTGTAGFWYSLKGKTDQAGNKALKNIAKAKAFDEIRPSLLKRLSKK